MFTALVSVVFEPPRTCRPAFVWFAFYLAQPQPHACPRGVRHTSPVNHFLAIPILALSVTLVFNLLSAGPQVGSPAPARSKKPEPGPDVLVVADVLVNDPESVLPRPGKPVYYVLLGSSEYTLGSFVAGEKMPTRDEIERQIVSILAERDFLRTQVGGPKPKIALVVAYGPANLLSDGFEDLLNREEISQLVGAVKMRKRLMTTSQAYEIDSAATEDRLYVLIAALDAPKLAQGKKQLVWRTFMSIPSVGNSLPECLTILLKSGAPYFARDTDAPIFVDDVDRRKAVVELGELEVLDDEPAPEPAPRGQKRDRQPTPTESESKTSDRDNQ